MEPLFASNNEAALNMLTCRLKYSFQMSLIFCSYYLDSSETMQAFLEYFDKNYGGAEEYIRRYVGLSDDDVATIKNNILIIK